MAKAIIKKCIWNTHSKINRPVAEMILHGPQFLQKERDRVKSIALQQVVRLISEAVGVLEDDVNKIRSDDDIKSLPLSNTVVQE